MNFKPIYACSFRRYALRAFHSLSGKSAALETPTFCSQLTFRRFKKIPRRKPTWMPRAKTKLFIFYEKIELPEEEENQMRELKSHYETEMASIVAYCAAENEKLLLEEHPASIEEDFSKLLIENDTENKRVGKIREAVLAAELSSAKQALLKKARLEDEWLSAKKKEVESIVKYEKEQSKHFMTLENLEHAISEAIDNPVNYNFAIDLSGQVLWETNPHPEASPHWTDDTPRQKLGNPPSQPAPVFIKRTPYKYVTSKKWY